MCWDWTLLLPGGCLPITSYQLPTIPKSERRGYLRHVAVTFFLAGPQSRAENVMGAVSTTPGRDTGCDRVLSRIFLKSAQL